MNQSFEKSSTPIIKPESESSNVGNFNLFSGKNLIIVILTALLIFSFLGINLLVVLGNLLQTIINIFSPLITQILSVFGYTAGTILDKTEDVATSVAKAGIDIAGGTVQSVADLLKKGSIDNVNPQAINELDRSLNTKQSRQPNYRLNEPSPDTSENNIQKPITSDKNVWCLVGEYEGKRGCVEVNDASKCLSGQVFPNEQMCLNPTKTVYMHSHAA